MKKLSNLKISALFFFCLLLIFSSTQAGEGGLTDDIIKRSRDEYHANGKNAATYNAVTNNDIRALTLNREILRNHNEHFSNKIKTKGVVDQKSSGRCWAFAWLNTMQPSVVDKYKLKDFEFAQNYIVFWDKMEKANTFLELVIELRDRDLLDREMEHVLESPFGDGGYWTYAAQLIKKYGVVPKEIMPETHSSENTKYMNGIISKRLRMDAAKILEMNKAGATVDEMRAFKEDALVEVYRLLALNLGEPPTEFEWRYELNDSTLSETETYTPKSFFKDFVQYDLDDFVSIFNNPTREFQKHYISKNSREMFDTSDIDHVNVEVEQLKKMAIASILDNQPLYVSLDTGKDMDGKLGIMAMHLYDYQPLFDVDLTMSKKDMGQYRQSSSNHGMSIIGVDLVDGIPVKWLVENSWGDDNKKDGLWTMYDDWFDNYVYQIAVRKKYVPKEILKIFEEEPIEIPYWDPVATIPTE